jgi:hypothetical protein
VSTPEITAPTVGRLSFVETHKLSFFGLLFAAPGLALALVFRPISPDLIAQLARIAANKDLSGAHWWTSWYGGVTTPSYSVISPQVMGALGVWVAGALSVVVTVVVAARLLEGARRSHLALGLVGLGAVADVVSGRVTFAIGLALAAVALLYVVRDRPLLAAPFAILSALARPLATLFLLIVVAGLVIANKTQRRTGIVTIGAALIALGTIQLLYPQPGDMPMDWTDLVGGLVVCAAFLLARPGRLLTVVGVLFAVAIAGAYFVPSPVGSNILRLPMLFTAAVLIATSSVGKRALLVLVAVALGWSISTSAEDLMAGHSPSSDAKFYAPLLAHLPADGGPDLNRVEVVDPATHGPALYVAAKLPLARGWERQIDVQRDPIFYDGTLNATTYHQWLNQLAVKWIAVPNARLDYASRSEAMLVAGGLPYLSLEWSNNDWTLYRVVDPAPLATGAITNLSMTPDSLTMTAAGPTESDVQLAWQPRLDLDSVDNPAVGGTVTKRGEWIHVSLPAAGTYTLHQG